MPTCAGRRWALGGAQVGEWFLTSPSLLTLKLDRSCRGLESLSPFPFSFSFSFSFSLPPFPPPPPCAPIFSVLHPSPSPRLTYPPSATT